MKKNILFIFILNLTLPITDLLGINCQEKNRSIYKKCINQLNIFDHIIKTSKKKNLIILGFNTCPWCISLDKAMKNNHTLHRFISKFTVTKIHGRVDSGKKVIQKLKKMSKQANFKIGFPFLAMVNSTTKKTVLRSLEPIEHNTDQSKAHHYDQLIKLIQEMDQAVK